MHETDLPQVRLTFNPNGDIDIKSNNIHLVMLSPATTKPDSSLAANDQCFAATAPERQLRRSRKDSGFNSEPDSEVDNKEFLEDVFEDTLEEDRLDVTRMTKHNEYVQIPNSDDIAKDESKRSRHS